MYTLIDIVSPADQLLNWNIFTIIFLFFYDIVSNSSPSNAILWLIVMFA